MSWQPIATAPKDGKRFLAVDSTGFIEILYWSPANDYPLTDCGDCPDFAPTDWMPLPEPPK